MTEDTEETARPVRTGDDRLPGDLGPEQTIERILRVDHAGEYGAARIYAGQLAVLGRDAVAPVIREMADAESKHLETFDRLLSERRVRPTLLAPFWHVAGFALGAGSALIGRVSGGIFIQVLLPGFRRVFLFCPSHDKLPALVHCGLAQHPLGILLEVGVIALQCLVSACFEEVQLFETNLGQTAFGTACVFPGCVFDHEEWSPKCRSFG